MSDIKTCGYHPTEGARIFDGPTLPAGWFDSPAKLPPKPKAAPEVTGDRGAEVAEMERAATLGRAEIKRLKTELEALHAELDARDASIDALRKETTDLSAQLEQLTAPPRGKGKS